MRVFDHGIMWTELKTTCDKCSCDFIYRPKDIRDELEYDYESKTGRAYKYVPCPECGNECIYTDPILERTYNDRLTGSPTGEDPNVDIIYDGGDLDSPVGG